MHFLIAAKHSQAADATLDAPGALSRGPADVPKLLPDPGGELGGLGRRWPRRRAVDRYALAVLLLPRPARRFRAERPRAAVQRIAGGC